MNKLLIFTLFASISCNSPDYNVTFTGFDYRKCLCCGGYEVTLEDGEQVIGVDVSETLGDASDKKFPFKAYIEYSKSDGCDNNILIKKVEEE